MHVYIHYIHTYIHMKYIICVGPFLFANLLSIVGSSKGDEKLSELVKLNGLLSYYENG